MADQRFVLYLRSDNRAWTAQAPVGSVLPDALTANTIPFEVSFDDYQTYLAALQLLAAGTDLVINDDGSTGTVAHTLSPQERVNAALRTFAAIASPTLADVVTALSALASTHAPIYTWSGFNWGDGGWGSA